MIMAQESFLDLNAFSYGEASGGNCYSGIIGSSGNMIYNPAVNADIIGGIVYEHKFLFGNISSYNAAAITIPITDAVNTGAGYINQNIDNIPVYPEFPTDPDSVDFEPLGYFSDNAHAFFVNISYTHRPSAYAPYEITGGINVKYIIHNIYNSTGMGAGLDGGINMLFHLSRLNYRLDGKAIIFIAVNDIGSTSVKWSTASEITEKRQYTLTAGLAYRLPVDLLRTVINTEINGKYGSKKGMGMSADILFNDMIGIFTGINYIQSHDNYAFEYEGAGIRLRFSRFELMYGISNNEIGINHSVTVGYSL